MKQKTLFERYISGWAKVQTFEVGDDTHIDIMPRDESTDGLLLALPPQNGAAGMVFKLQKQLQEKVDRLRRAGAPADLVREQVRQGVLAASKKYAELVKTEAKQAHDRITAARDDYEKTRYQQNPMQSLLRTQEAAARIQSMTSKELLGEAENYIGQPDARDPVEVDMLVGSLRQSEPAVADVLRETAVRNGYQLPWLAREETAVKTIGSFEGLAPGEVLIRKNDGVGSLSIASLVDMDSPIVHEVQKEFSL